MVSDVAGAVRAALTHRANTPDLYTIMQIMGEEKVRERFKKFIEDFYYNRTKDEYKKCYSITSNKTLYGRVDRILENLLEK